MAKLDLVVFTYPNREGAAAALASVATAKQENVQAPLVAVNDAAVAVKEDNGKVKINQTLESLVKGTRVMGGGFWGLLIGLLLGGPLVGALVGMGLRAFGNRSIDIGIDNDFIKQVSDSLSPGQSVLFLLTEGADPADVNAALGDHGGTLHHTTLDSEAAEAIDDLSKDDTIADAIADDIVDS